MKKKVTSTDIAHAAGVSQSTVSMILNKKYDVSFAKETVEKVENAAKELGYVPPKRKTRKGTKREKLLVVFCPNLTNPYYVMLLQGIEAHATERSPDGRTLSENDVAVTAAGDYLHLQSEPLLYGSGGRDCRTDTGCDRK
mgnify:CR=1 FL=1